MYIGLEGDSQRDVIVAYLLANGFLSFQSVFFEVG